jgi:uncharacterized repeat protein (TIGR03803 family)
VVLDSAGNLYGTTFRGGTEGWGVVYKLDAAGNLTVLYSFMGGVDGASPMAAVIRDAAGNLYGTVDFGGTGESGAVFMLNAAGKEIVLYSFPGGVDGGYASGVIRDSAGNIYGATAGGTWGAGVVYKLDRTGHETVLYTFTGGADGGSPSGSVTRDSAGDLYGTASIGGIANQGVVYKLDPAGHETVLYSFTGGTDGGYPTEGVVLDSSGNLYRTTATGGTGPFQGYGVVFELDTAGHETVLYTFTGSDLVNNPQGVIRDSAGNLYGTTSDGLGGVYKLDTTGHETVLHNFMIGEDGQLPNPGLILDSAGNLYRTTYQGGTSNAGIVYKLDAAGHETVLCTFSGGTDGGNPSAGLTLDSVGNLYGTTYYGGTGEAGVVFKLDITGHETVLYNFMYGADGYYPQAGVIRDSTGNLYGTTSGGGTKNNGVLFKIEPRRR